MVQQAAQMEYAGLAERLAEQLAAETKAQARSKRMLFWDMTILIVKPMQRFHVV